MNLQLQVQLDVLGPERSRDENDGSEAAQVLRHPTFTGESDARQFPGHFCFRMVKLGVAGLAIIMYNNVVYSIAIK